MSTRTDASGFHAAPYEQPEAIIPAEAAEGSAQTQKRTEDRIDEFERRIQRGFELFGLRIETLFSGSGS